MLDFICRDCGKRMAEQEDECPNCGGTEIVEDSGGFEDEDDEIDDGDMVDFGGRRIGHEKLDI